MKHMEERNKLVLVATHAGEDPDRATIPFVMANAALASGMDATVVLQSVGVMLGVKDYATHVRAEGFPPLNELVSGFIELGGKLLMCSPCLKARNIQEGDLIEGAKVVAAASVVSETASTNSSLVY